MFLTSASLAGFHVDHVGNSSHICLHDAQAQADHCPLDSEPTSSEEPTSADEPIFEHLFENIYINQLSQFSTKYKSIKNQPTLRQIVPICKTVSSNFTLAYALFVQFDLTPHHLRPAFGSSLLRAPPRI